MPGSVQKRSKKSWTVVIDLERDPKTGRRRQLRRSIKGTKKEAEALLVQLLHERDIGIDQPPNKLTLAEYLTRWLEDYAYPNTAPKTYQRYAQIIKNNIIPALGGIMLASLRPQHIQRYYSHALKDGRIDRRKGGLSARTVLHHHRVLNEALRHAVRWQLMVRNPAEAVEPPRPIRSEMQVLSPESINTLLASCKDHNLYAIIYLAVATGLRQGELLGLRWDAIDLDSSSLSVTRTLQYISGLGLIFREPKTAGSRRKVSLSDETVRMLREHRKHQIETRLSLGPAYNDQNLVFANALGNPIPPYIVSEKFNILIKRIGLSPLRFHDLRHTSATLLLRAGVHPKIVSERLGHSGVAITLDTYSHVLPDLQSEAANLMDKLLVIPQRVTERL